MTISETVRRAWYSTTTGEVSLGLVTIDHDDLAEPLRFVGNTSDVISRSNIYVAAPFVGHYPPQGGTGEPTMTLEVENIDRSISDLLALATGKEVEFTYEVVLASAPNTVVMGPFTLPLRSSETGISSVRLTLGGIDPLLSRKWPLPVFTTAEFAGLTR